MDIFLSEAFCGMEDDQAVKLAKITSCFANIFYSNNFWIQRAKKMGIPIKECDIKHQIRKFNNTRTIPNHIICTHFKSPDPTWTALDVYFLCDSIHVLFKTDAGMCKMTYNADGSVNPCEEVYEGLITRFGTQERGLIDVFQDHPRAFKKLRQTENNCSWNLDLIHQKDHIVEKRYPFSSILWKSGSFDFEMQRKLQSLGTNRIIKYFFSSSTVLTVVYCQYDQFTVAIWDGKRWSDKSDSMVCCDDAFYNIDSHFWCLKSQKNLVIIRTDIDIIFNTISIPVTFDFEIVDTRNNAVFLRQKCTATIFRLDVNDFRNIQTIMMGKEQGCGMIFHDEFLCCWKPLEGKLMISDQSLHHSFLVYYACLGKSDLRNSDGEKTKFFEMISSEDGLLVRVENSKYILVEF